MTTEFRKGFEVCKWCGDEIAITCNEVEIDDDGYAETVDIVDREYFENFSGIPKVCKKCATMEVSAASDTDLRMINLWKGRTLKLKEENVLLKTKIQKYKDIIHKIKKCTGVNV